MLAGILAVLANCAFAYLALMLGDKALAGMLVARVGATFGFYTEISRAD